MESTYLLYINNFLFVNRFHCQISGAWMFDILPQYFNYFNIFYRMNILTGCCGIFCFRLFYWQLLLR